MSRPLTHEMTIGDRIQARRLMRGWSVRYAASRAGISHATWSRIERGLQAADNRFVLADIAAALECAPVDLTGTPMPAADRQAMAAHHTVYAIRQALVEADATDFETRLPRALPELERTVALVRDLRFACDYAGAGRLLPDLLRDLYAACAADRNGRVLRMLCQITSLAASVLRSLGYPAEAWLGAERCREVAMLADDPVLLGFAAFARAQAAIACGSYSRGLALAERAANDIHPSVSSPGGVEMLGTLQLMCAWASRGLRRPSDSETWTAEAATLAHRTGETTVLDLFFGPTNVNFWRISTETDGGDPDRAVDIARTTNPTVIAAKMRQVYFYTDTARAYARTRGQDRDAIRYLLTAERIAPQHVHSSALVQETARALLERARRQAGGVELRGLCARMGMAD